MPERPDPQAIGADGLLREKFRLRITKLFESLDPVQDAIEDEQFREDAQLLEAAEDEDDLAKRLALVQEADGLAVRTLPDLKDSAVKLEDAREAMKLLAVAVAFEVAHWPGRHPLRAEVIAAGICWAVAKARKEWNVKHPRVMAKEVHVRPQTLWKIIKLTTQEIQRLNLEPDLIPPKCGKREPIMRVRKKVGRAARSVAA